MLAFYALLAQFYNPVVRLTQFHGTVAGTLAAVERIAEVLEEPETPEMSERMIWDAII